MRDILNDFSKVFSYILCIFIIGISFYIVWSNFLHIDYLNDKINTFSTDQLIVDYNAKISTIENNIKNFQYDEDKFSTNISRTTLLKSELNSCMTLYHEKYDIKIFDNAAITFNDLFTLNDSFGKFYDDCWVSALYELKKTNKKDYITDLYDNGNRVNSVLVDNYRYIKKDVLSNVNTKYVSDISKKSIKNDLEEDYKMIMNNYINFLDQLKIMSDFLKGGDLLDN